MFPTTTTTVTGIDRRRFVATTSRSRNCHSRFKSSSTTTTTTTTTEAAAAVAAESSPKVVVVDESVPIGASLLAAIAGVGVVATSAYIVENVTADTCLPFSANSSEQRYTQNTFQGRFFRMLLACDPTLLIYTENQIQKSKQILLDYENENIANVKEEEGGKLEAISKEQQQQNNNINNRILWESRRIVESAIHPDTGEIIPRPFRMSGYVPCNGPICVSMVASSSTIPLLFWSWINQTQNALVNYYVSKHLLMKLMMDDKKRERKNYDDDIKKIIPSSFVRCHRTAHHISHLFLSLSRRRRRRRPSLFTRRFTKMFFPRQTFYSFTHFFSSNFSIHLCIIRIGMHHHQ